MLLNVVPGQRFLALFELFENVTQHLCDEVVADTALDDDRRVPGVLHDPTPRLVDIREPLRLVRQLSDDLDVGEDGVEVEPEVLNDDPRLDDRHRVGQLPCPLLDLYAERLTVPASQAQPCWQAYTSITT